MGFFDFLIHNPVIILVSICAGAIYGLIMGIGKDIKDKMAWVGISVLVWGLVFGSLSTFADYNDYKNHYTTCEKPVAKRAGYIFADNRCWKPTNSYVKVNQTTKTKQELLNAK